MKTTIDIADDLLDRARKVAASEGRTLREVVEEALRKHLADRRRAREFRLKRHAFRGRGLQSGLVEGDWDKVRDLIYRTG